MHYIAYHIYISISHESIIWNWRVIYPLEDLSGIAIQIIQSGRILEYEQTIFHYVNTSSKTLRNANVLIAELD